MGNCRPTTQSNVCSVINRYKTPWVTADPDTRQKGLFIHKTPWVTRNPQHNNNNNNNCIQRRNSRIFTISSLHREPSPTRMLKCNTLSVHHMQHVMLIATWCKGTAQLLSLTECCRIYLSFILLVEPLTDEGGEKTGEPGENPGDELQKMPHTEARRFKPQARLEPAQ